jgi:long-chain fatty acid transport protein
MAMGSAMVADVNDSSAIFYNPAGLAQGGGIDVSVGDTLIIPSVQFSDTFGITSNNVVQVVPPPHFYAAVGLTDLWSVGLGVFSPYGTAVRWHSNWEGETLSEDAALATYDINPSAALNLGRVRIGAGLQIVRSTLQLVQGLVLPNSQGHFTVEAGAWGVGGNGGIQVDAIPELLSFGLQYRSAVRLNYSGTGEETGLSPGVAAPFAKQSMSTHLTLPDTVSLGVAGKPLPQLRLGLDVVYTSWQHFRSLDLSFQNPMPDQSIAKDWSHTVSMHLGGQYQLTDEWAVRLGLIYDPSPVPADTLGPDIPDSARVSVCAGAGYQTGPLRADLGYQLVILTGATSTLIQLPGRYSGFANVVGLSFGFHI